MKKYRFLLITLGVLIVVVVALAAVIVNFRQNQSFSTVARFLTAPAAPSSPGKTTRAFTSSIWILPASCFGNRAV